MLGSAACNASANGNKPLTVIEQGKQIYRDGLLISGQPLVASTPGELEATGQYLACVSCHRRSGLGSYEGSVQIPPIASRILFPTQSDSRLAQVSKAYTEASLKETLQSGITPDGRMLSPLMPRYRFQTQDMDALIAYLKTLSAHDSPGADAQNLHFATVVSDKTPAKERKLMLELMQKYFPPASVVVKPKKPQQLQTPQSRAALFQNMRRLRVPNYFPARKLQLHVWELTGPHSSWAKQLDRYYREQPVFALLGGLAKGSWQPVHEFCEHNEVPCLFPNTIEPVVAEHDFYNLYFTKGMNVEGAAVAKHIQQTGATHGNIVQVFRRGDTTAERAALGLYEEARQLSLNPIHDRIVSQRGAISPAFWTQLLRENRPENLVLWLKADDLKSLAAIGNATAELRHLYLSATLTGTLNPMLTKKLQPLTYLTHRYLVPTTAAYEQVDTFMHNNAFEFAQHPEQLWLAGDTVWAMSLISEAVRQMKYNSRDLLVELVEMMVSRKPPLLYPRLGLADDQRFASKGCFVVPLNKPDQAEWIIP
jgi:cytochrome c553